MEAISWQELIGSQIQLLRERQRITQEGLARLMRDLAGLTWSRSTVAAVETKRRGIDWIEFIGLMQVLNSLISVYYYFRVTVKIYMQAPEKELEGLALRPAMAAALALTAVGTLWVGIFPNTYLDLAKQAIPQLF